MKRVILNILLFLLSFISVIGFAFNSYAAWPGECTYWYIKINASPATYGSYYENFTYSTVIDFQNGTVSCNSGNGYDSIEAGGTYYTSVIIVPYYWDGTNWTSNNSGANCGMVAVNEYLENPGVSGYPWIDEPDGCPAPPVCPDEGTVLTGGVAVPGKWPGESCIDDCIYEESGDMSTYDYSEDETIYYNMTSTGENCTDEVEGESDPLIEPPLDDNDDIAPYPTVLLTGIYYPDQDKDGTASGNDSDVDGDGKGNLNDGDVDGDGTPNGSDNDVDGDGESNGGRKGHWTYPTSISSGDGTEGGENDDGIGADTDVDGDDVENGNDCDIDGDGWSNEEDGDMDGDGVLNGSDSDTDGDGTINSSDSTPYGQDCSGGTSDQTEGTGTVEGGDGTTPEETEAEEEGESPGEGDVVQEASCPEGKICIGDGVCQTGEPNLSVDCYGSTNYFEDRFTTFKTNMGNTDMFSLLDNIATIPSGGNAVQSVNLGTWGGVQTFDWSELDFVWSILSAVFLIAFSWIGIKIIILKKD